MVIDDRDELRQLLQSLDDPEHMEQPSDFDLASTEERFVRLVEALESTFDAACHVDSGTSVQDAGHFGQVWVPAEATRSGVGIFVRVSNFGSTVVYGLETPGAYLDDEKAVLLDERDREQIQHALTEGGYTIVPEAILWERYDGQSAWLCAEPHSSSFTRFFDYQ